MNNPTYRLLLIEPDLLFRLGLRTWLAQFPDLTLVAEADTAEQGLSLLAGVVDNLERSKAVTPRNPAIAIDLVIVGIGPGTLSPLAGLDLCQTLKDRYPTLPLLWFCTDQDATWVATAVKRGVEGYCFKGNSPEVLVAAIRQVASGQTYRGDPILDRNLAMADRTSVQLNPPLSVWSVLKQNLYWSGIRHIDSALSDLNAELENIRTSSTADLMVKAVIAGRMRELSAARWVVSRVWQPSRIKTDDSEWMAVESRSGEPLRGQGQIAIQENRDRQLANVRAIQMSLFEATAAKLQDNLTNLTSTPLEIDILREEQKRELLYILLRQVETILSELRLSQTQLHQLPEKQSVILKDLWQMGLTEFFGKYYTLTDKTKGNIGVVDVLLQDGDGVATAILNKIPQVSELLSHLLFQTPLVVDSQVYEIGTAEAMHRAQMLLDNLLIQLANAVIQPLLNHFADVEEVKQKFYTYTLLASRDIERFRNDLSWKYRMEQYVAEPQAIFESRYILLGLANPGIGKNTIYAPRTQELQQLQGIRLAVTLALELQDAIAPRLRSALSFVGSGVVYVLTNVVGRGIGLIGRGVLQGIGSAWDESRFRPKGRSQ